MKSVAFHNLGCKVNGYETDVMQQKLLQSGFVVVPFDEKADVYVVNTCTVTNIADRKSRQMLHRAKKRNPDALVVAVGCYVETDPDKVSLDPAIDLAIGNNKKGQIAELILEWMKEHGKAKPASRTANSSAREDGCGNRAADGEAQPPCDKTLGGRSMADLTQHLAYEEMTLTAPSHTRAYVKIQDGCNQFCSYCIIPYARGRIRSRERADVLAEVRALARGGVREIVLTGIHVSSYGLDRGCSELLGLLEELEQVEGLARIRLSSLEPRIITEEFAARLAALSKLCPHFHLSLQSGCDETLRRMNRRYTTAEYAQSVERLRRVFDRPAICTDIIVGFPGETDEEFAQTLRFAEQIGFYEIHVFKYSVRKGTAAARMKPQVPEPVKAERSDRLLALTARQAAAYRAQFLGEREELLLEEEAEVGGVCCMTGHTKRYVLGAVRQTGALCRCEAVWDAERQGGSGGESGRLVPGALVRGIFTEAVAGTPYLRMEAEG